MRPLLYPQAIERRAMITADRHEDRFDLQKKRSRLRYLWCRSESAHRAERQGGAGEIPPPLRSNGDRCPAPEYSGVPVHGIFGNLKNKHPPGCSYRGGHYNGRNCRVVLAAAAQEDLEDLVNDEQDEG